MSESQVGGDFLMALDADEGRFEMTAANNGEALGKYSRCNVCTK